VIRILVATRHDDPVEFERWRTVRDAHPLGARMALQRVVRAAPGDASPAVGLGYGESLSWFGPIDSDALREAAIACAAQVLANQGFAGTVDVEDSEFARRALTVPTSPGDAPSPAARRGILLLSHAETDLLVLERARSALPASFPDVSGCSLLDRRAEDLLQLIGTQPARELLVILRIHGTAASVPGLTALLDLAHRDGWGLVVISGVAGSAEILPRTSNVSALLASHLTSYFMFGGIDNIGQALRFAAHEQLRWDVTYELPRPMPDHGLYHPDLLVTHSQEWTQFAAPSLPVAAIVFYRAHVLSGNLAFVDTLIRSLEKRGFAAIGLFTSSLRDGDAGGMPLVFRQLPRPPDVTVNTLSFPLFRADTADTNRCFEELGAPLLQAICCGSTRAAWQQSARGLSAIEATMHVALPEVDGRIITVPICFKENHRYAPEPERIERVSAMAARFARLRHKPNDAKRVAVILSNAGGKAQRVGGAVGLDTPASLLKWLCDMRTAGYRIGDLPASGDALMNELLARGCYDERHPLDSERAWRLPRARYVDWFKQQSASFQRSLTDAWGMPASQGATIAPPFWRGTAARGSPLLALYEPHTDEGHYLFAAVEYGQVLVVIQPPRSFGVDDDTAYHSPDLPPCHHYAAFYHWLDQYWQADALIHFGTHGTLEWLPGKSLALSNDCAPDVILGDLPLFYPFVVNNPGEGAQAKRRTHAVIVDHLVAPLTQAENHGVLATLARLVEEYYRAEIVDPRKLPLLRREIWDAVQSARLEEDLRLLRLERHGSHEHPWDERLSNEGVPRALEQLSGRGFAHLISDLDTYLCDLGRAQIRNGLHVFGVAPRDDVLNDYLFAILQTPNGDIPSLVEAVTGEPDRGLRVGEMRRAVDARARNVLQALAARQFDPDSIDAIAASQPGDPARIKSVLEFVCRTLVPALADTTDETRNLLTGLNGGYVPAGAAGSPSRGMAHVLPTGRNFHSADPRGLPSPSAWTIGQQLARESLDRHRAERGDWPQSVAISIWGTPTMRTGGDDIAQALALIGARPVWDSQTRRTTGFEIIDLAALGRPRIDVTLRVSGFFRDAFPGLMHMFDQAVAQIVLLDESVDDNYLRRHWLAECAQLQQQGCSDADAARRASYRVFSSRPGAYGTGLAEIIDSGTWRHRADLAESVLVGGGWAFTPEAPDGVEATDAFRRKLAGIELVMQNQDQAEQDLFDSSDYFEFHGGLIAAVQSLSGSKPAAYVGDSSLPSRPAVRTLQSQALRVHRTRITNPKWLDGIMRHGYRGGMEMVATVDALFGFAATADLVSDWMFEDVARLYADGSGREFLERSNAWALNAIVERLLEASERKLWHARPETLQRLQSTWLRSETEFELATEQRS
jgi:cobaltochelatase CobN